MSEEAGEHPSITERITEKIHEYRGSSSSSDSDNEKPFSHSTRKKRLFGRRDPVHTVFGGGKSADIILWRNKQMSGGILAGVTVIWLLFEWMGYHLLTFICHSLIFLLAVSFIWSNAASFVNRSPPKFPEVILPEDMFLSIAHAVRYQINEAFSTFIYVASGKDLKQFMMVIAGLWVLSVIGSWFSFLTLFYIVFLITYTAPALYEKYEDQVDTVAGKAMVEINRHYAVLDEKVLQKIPRGPFTDKKQL
ncbi:reticulon-like protein B4 [Elaeis guineensis]|uniref:Reticulon-like protein n=1 Tax=Elaeis guineensis var. tenera TaxID=51953 RepID=A0A6I9S5X0_ELAGV|nr:reticulon-like protein B1 [Elaeis guineensis]XP_029124154.1 reticulon-like protein B1 [Elaeis guineensis]